MSIVSSYEPDKSSFLCKRFASLAVHYFDEPEAAKSQVARVPLENLFRVLEMYRNDAFADDSRVGILELGEVQNRPFAGLGEDLWYEGIQHALGSAVREAFNDVSKEEAVEDLQSSLRWLVKGGDLANREEKLTRARFFFDRLHETLI
ncbi:hypothetical protein FCJ61_05885 [Burkholderia metallica]|uniref:hypothetical protein n=1 Tax=Burkholderia metallica TaxID=488729 RepID=UPI00157B7844|nr:hypothetical protein [Burkholderia metallica]NTZ82544.1 hypothetical protein [Burkholderia metallica]